MKRKTLWTLLPVSSYFCRGMIYYHLFLTSHDYQYYHESQLVVALFLSHKKKPLLLDCTLLSMNRSQLETVNLHDYDIYWLPLVLVMLLWSPITYYRAAVLKVFELPVSRFPTLPFCEDLCLSPYESCLPYMPLVVPLVPFIEF